MNTKSKVTNLSLIIKELVEETWNSFLGIMTEDVYCADNFALWIVLVTDWKDIDKC